MFAPVWPGRTYGSHFAPIFPQSQYATQHPWNIGIPVNGEGLSCVQCGFSHGYVRYSIASADTGPTDLDHRLYPTLSSPPCQNPLSSLITSPQHGFWVCSHHYSSFQQMPVYRHTGAGRTLDPWQSSSTIHRNHKTHHHHSLAPHFPYPLPSYTTPSVAREVRSPPRSPTLQLASDGSIPWHPSSAVRGGVSPSELSFPATPPPPPPTPTNTGAASHLAVRAPQVHAYSAVATHHDVFGIPPSEASSVMPSHVTPSYMFPYGVQYPITPPYYQASWAWGQPCALWPYPVAQQYDFAPSLLTHDGVTFKVTHFLGEGSAGRVVLAEHRGCLYAIKAIHPRRARLAWTNRANFKRERDVMIAIGKKETARRFLVPLLMSWEEQRGGGEGRIFFVMVRRQLSYGECRLLNRILAVLPHRHV